MNVLIVDDSALIRSILKEIFAGDADISVIGEASNGEKAIHMTTELKPDLIIMDINMPIMDGITATGKIMKLLPTPILVFSTEIEADIGFKACQAGAVDVMRKPDIGRFNDRSFATAFKSKLLAVGRATSGSAPGTKASTAPCSNGRREVSGRPDSNPDTTERATVIPKRHPVQLIVLGASTGGPKAVRQVLSQLRANFSRCIAVVQHLESGFDRGYVEWLNQATPLDVRLVEQTVSFTPGCVFVAPIDKHLKVRGTELVIDDGPKVLNQKPAVDVLFSSAAESLSAAVLGVLLTGMGRDGASGCAGITGRGGVTIVEDRSTAAIFGMPKAAIELGAATYVLPLHEIAAGIMRVAGE